MTFLKPFHAASLDGRMQLRMPGRGLREVALQSLPLDRLERAVTPAGWERLQAGLEAAGPIMEGRRVWLVNSTAVGGGVAEMIRSLVPYARGAGFDAHWIVIPGPPAFFFVTKELHNQLHGHRRRRLDAAARTIYESTLSYSAAKLASMVAPGDVVILHDPQTAGLVDPLRRAGAVVIWRCHVGTDRPGPVMSEAWEFLLPYLRNADAFVFSRARFVPPSWQAGDST